MASPCPAQLCLGSADAVLHPLHAGMRWGGEIWEWSEIVYAPKGIDPRRYLWVRTHIMYNIGVRGSPERDILSLRAFGPRGRQVLRVVRVTARALFDVFEEK